MKSTDNQGQKSDRINQSTNLSTADVDKLVKMENLVAFSISKPTLDTDYLSYYRKWINNNFNAKMNWMENNIEVRTDLTKRFPWAKTVIIVADNYYLEKQRKIDTLKISRYAWGDDYHKVLEKKLKRILESLKNIDKSITGKVYVDTGPILEKAFAADSGLGWMGKNSCIIVPDYGSFCFLGILIINKEVESEKKIVKSQCGSCEDCIKACPTGALEKPYVLNANNCISYFSIEKKEDFTKQEADWLQDWLYGCDICLSACPWNKKWAKTSMETSYFNRISLLEKSEKEWKELTEHEFGILFQKNVFKRLKYSRFRRNLLKIIKNL